MHPLISAALPRIEEACKRHGVRALYLFGSATTGTFDPVRSDFDFIVDFGSADLGPWMSAVFEFQRSLQTILGRPVDVVLASSLGHSQRGHLIESQKVPVYAAA
ncbi:MAG: nucleotidyltransferase domain-containing protein [Phycisphaerales bacterium]|nr:nucleotidyltransferase domain-containing protein [Phycisphaerales bacterium]